MNDKITELEELNEELNAILISNPDFIFTISSDEVYLNVFTHRPQDLFIPKEKFIGMTIKETIPLYAYEKVKIAFDKALETNELEIVKYYIDFENERRYYEARMKKYFNKIMCIVRDNSAEENLKIDLMNQKKFIDDITKKSPFFIYVYDLVVQHLIFFNKKLSELYDIESDDGDSLKIVTQIIHPDDLDGFINYRSEHIKINDYEPRSREVRMRLKSKDYIWVKITNRIIEKTSDDQPKQILGIIEDINERKNNQDELINYNNFINNVLELSPMLINIFDSFDNSISYLNKKFSDETFYSAEDINSLDHGFLSLILEEDIYNISKAIQNLVKDKSQEKTVNYRIKNKKGNILWLESTLNIFNLNSNRVDIICVSVDITKRVENEQKIRELEKRWEFALEGSGDGVWDWNAITNKVFFSRQWKSMLGYEENEIGDSLEEWDKRVHPDDKEEVYKKLNAHFDGKTEIYLSQHRVLTKNGTYKWIFDRGKIIERDEENKPLRVIGTHTDISQLIETQEKLKESENRLKNIIDAAGEYIWESDLQNRYTFVSDRFTKILGYSQKEVIGKTPYDFMPDVEKKKLQEQFFLVRTAESKFSNVIFKIRRKDGELVWHSINCKPILNNEGNAIGYRGVGQDITERVFREKEIKEKNEYLELAERTAKLGNWIIDFENSKVTWSNETKRIHEVPLDYEPILETGINFYAPEVRQKVQDLVAKSIETGEGWEFELPLITAKGNRIWVHVIADVIRENDRTKKIFGTFQDISERKKIQSERDNIFNMSLDLISITGTDGYFKELNFAWHDTLEYSIDELLKRPIWDFIHPEDIEKTQKSFINVMLDPVIGFENRFVTKSGKVVWFAWNSQSNPEDKLVYSITRNITNQKKQENLIKNAKEDAEIANKSKSTFLANMSHEIRTPMNSILGFGELLKNRIDDEQGIKYINSMMEAGKTLLTLINDILDLSKIEAGKLDIQKSEINAANITKEIGTMFSVLASKKNIMFNMNIDNNFPDLVLLDEVRLRQILLNIIGNALKFTEKGKIDVNLSYNLNNSLIFEIVDTGIGIKESSINSIFDEFKQQDEQLTRKYGGTGLGLSISKKLAEMMNGTISVKSKFGEGSTFKVEFKDVEIIIKAQKEEKLSEINVEFQKSKILIVDDNDLNLFLIETILKQLGDFKIIKATNGQQAVERIKDNNINLVFMDIHMPVMDGKTATIKIKENINYKIPVVALTALAMSHDVEEYSKYFDGYIVKPVEINKVREVLQKYIINNVTETTISQEKNSEKFQLGQNDIFSINEIINTEIEILINSLEIDRISEIANKILEGGKNQGNINIQEFGQELLDLCDSFDIENIINKLKILK